MRPRNIHRIPPVLLLLLVAGGTGGGCDETSEPASTSFRALGDHNDDGAQRGRPWPPSGGTLNTAWLGDMPLMRLLLPGQSGHSTRTSDVFITRVEIFDQDRYRKATSVSVSIDRGDLTVAVDDTVFRGPDLVGSRWWLSTSTQGFIEITDFGEHEHQFGYELTHHPASDFVSVSALCRPDLEGGQWAYIVGDVDVAPWGAITPDSNSLLIACASGALGKAISWGFRPWGEQSELQLDLYQTGVRTVMADYCGTGKSDTEDGTLIQVSNARVGQSFTDASADTEAVFGPDGALCLSNRRLLDEWLPPSVSECYIPHCGDDSDVAQMMDNDILTWTKLEPQ